MAKFDWQTLLTEWNRDYFTTPNHEKYSREFPPEFAKAKWLGYPPATEEQIQQAETRLGLKLPPSYREFLKVANGWWMPTNLIPRIRPVEEVEWLYETDYKELVDERIAYQHTNLSAYEYEEFFGENGTAESGDREGGEDIFWIKGERFKEVLLISDQEIAGTAVCLLNPKVVNAEGEWEAWYDAHWLPGTAVFGSFWKYMKNEQKLSVITLVKEGEDYE